MKVFISWSGEVSHKVAKVFRDWLPYVIQCVNPYVSSEDIDKGSRWSTDIAAELEESAYGILCVTRDNLEAPWLNFEAGALGKSVDKSRVSPFLFRVKRSEVNGPVLQFQSTIQEREELFKLVKSINAACGDDSLDESRLEKVFEVWWPELEVGLSNIDGEDVEVRPVHAGTTETSDIERLANVMEEVLELSRTNQKLLRDPEALLPMEYFEYIFDKSTSAHRKRRLSDDFSTAAIEDIIRFYRDVVRFAINMRIEMEESDVRLDELYALIRRMDGQIRHVARAIGRRLPRDLLDDPEIGL